jgi:hypothetical protein
LEWSAGGGGRTQVPRVFIAAPHKKIQKVWELMGNAGISWCFASSGPLFLRLFFTVNGCFSLFFLVRNACPRGSHP